MSTFATAKEKGGDLKKFKRKFEKTGAIRELRARKNFEKPSVRRRMAKMKAIYVQHLRLQEEQ